MCGRLHNKVLPSRTHLPQVNAMVQNRVPDDLRDDVVRRGPAECDG